MRETARILLIEDDTSLAANLCDVLKEDGFKVTVCHRGDEGLRRASNDECDVVLTDLRLPGLGGLDLVRQLHDTQPRLPVVLMTAHGTMETAIEATKSVFIQFFTICTEYRIHANHLQGTAGALSGDRQFGF